MEYDSFTKLDKALPEYLRRMLEELQEAQLHISESQESKDHWMELFFELKNAYPNVKKAIWNLDFIVSKSREYAKRQVESGKREEARESVGFRAVMAFKRKKLDGLDDFRRSPQARELWQEKVKELKTIDAAIAKRPK